MNSQGDGIGATGGKGGEGVASDYFMMRIGIPNGIVTPHQLRVIGGLTKKWASSRKFVFRGGFRYPQHMVELTCCRCCMALMRGQRTWV